MALVAELHIDNHEYSVMECEYEFTQAIDVTGRPSDRPRGGVLHMVIVAPDDNDLMLHEWMRDKDATKDGMVYLQVNKDSIKAAKTIKFEEAYCIRLYEYFNNNNAMPMFMKISIMASSLTFGGTCEFKMID